MVGDFASKLRNAMDERGWSVRVLAGRAGLPDEQVWDFLQGRAIPDEEGVEKLAYALGRPAASLSPPPVESFAADEPTTASRPRRGRLGFPVLRGDAIPAIVRTNPSWRRRELERIARRQKAIIRLLIHKGVFTREELDQKIAAVVTSQVRKRQGLP